MPLFAVNSLTPSAVVQLVFLFGQFIFIGILAHVVRKDREDNRRLLASSDRIEALLRNPPPAKNADAQPTEES